MPKPSLAEALANQQPRYGGPSCGICNMLTELDPDDAKALTAAFDNPRITATMIVKALQEFGRDATVSTVRRHRRRECSHQRNVG